MRAAVKLQAFLHPCHLFGCRLGLIGGFPFIERHAVNHDTSGSFIAFEACIANPVSKAIAAKTGKAHQFDVLGIVSLLQVLDQPAERGGSNVIGQIIDCIRIHSKHPWVLKWHRP